MMSSQAPATDWGGAHRPDTTQNWCQEQEAAKARRLGLRLAEVVGHEAPVRTRVRNCPGGRRRRRRLLLLSQDQETLRIQSKLGAEEPGHAAYVAALVGADLTRGNQYEVLTNGDQFLPAMLKAIAAARTRVVLETYIYDSGDVAAQFTTAFEEAARRGVSCAIVVDAVGSSGMDSEPRHTPRVGRMRRRDLQPAALVQARGTELPLPSQDPGGGRRGRLHRRRRVRGSLAGTRAGSRPLA